MDKNKRILITGNEAIGEGAIQAGCRFYAGYPITPQNELIAYMAKELPARGGVFIQAEAEVAAINMVFGASAAGARSMTSSSSPGISLKQEGISYIAGAELPAVIVNVMRAGPGLGNIWPAQSDYFQATKGGGHGDFHLLVLAPYTVQECYDFMFDAFTLADCYRNPVMILSDGLLGQMMEPILFKPQTAGHKSQVDKPWALTGCHNRKPNLVKSFYMIEGDLEKFNLALQGKYRTIINKEQSFEGLFLDDARVIIVAYGSMARIAKGAVKRLRLQGTKAGLLRPITLWPFPAKAFSGHLKKNTRYLVTEMSYGQMVEDVKLAVNGKCPVDFLGRSGGGIPSEEDIIAAINKLDKK
jgi:2-oxoglutarate/2-oxoacid ferredoxin oxidoreductase subunit alpha